MHPSPFLLAGAVLILIGCKADPLAVAPLDPTAEVVPHSSGGTPPTLRIKQTSSGESVPLGWCDQAAGVALGSSPGTGIGSHIGYFEVEQTACLNLATGAVTDGVATLFAKNGDELYMTYTGQPVPGLDPPTFDLITVIVGGTGRFANAEGEMNIRVVDVSPTTWTSSGSGWIRYSASDRSDR